MKFAALSAAVITAFASGMPTNGTETVGTIANARSALDVVALALMCGFAALFLVVLVVIFYKNSQEKRERVVGWTPSPMLW